MELLKRTCKKLRQELLNKALSEELEILRKKCFPMKRRKFLYEDIIIKELNFKADNQVGQYNFIDSKHVIQIDKNKVYACHKMPSNWIRVDYYKQLKMIIRHELIHAFVNSRYEDFCGSIEGKNHDASPIFLTVLNWVNGVSEHDCFHNFLYTKNYTKSLCCFDKFCELDTYIVNMIISYNNAIKGVRKYIKL